MTTAGDTRTETVLTNRLCWLRLFLTGLAGALGICGVVFGILMLLSRGDSEVPQVVGAAALPMIAGLVFGVVGLGVVFGRESGSGFGVIGLAVAAVLFVWARNKVADVADGGWQVNLAVDPTVLWASWALGCLASSSLVFMLFPLLRSRAVASRQKFHPRGRPLVALLCGALVAGVGIGVGRQFIVEELAPVKAVTAEAPEQLPELGPVFDARQATGEVAWTSTIPGLTENFEMQVGVRGPVVAGSAGVLGLNGETGQVLWSHEFRTRELKGTWSKLGDAMSQPRRLVVSPDGTAVAFMTCVENSGGPVITVLDAVTGQVRFSVRGEAEHGCWSEVAMTDHVVVVGGVAHDLVTGEEIWRHQEHRFVVGPNGSSHLMLILSKEEKEELHLRKSNCDSCNWFLKVVSDQDPEQETELLERVVGINEFSDHPMVFRGWVLEKGDAEGSYTWVNIDTLGRVPMELIDDELDGLKYWITDTPSFSALPGEAEKASGGGSLGVFDPWTGEYATFMSNTDHTRGSLGLGVRVNDSQGRLTLVGEDGSQLGEPIDSPEPPGEWGDYTGSVRTRYGIASGFKRTNGYPDTSVTIVMHR